MIDKINVSKIIKDHMSSFRDYRTNRYRYGDFLLFLGSPLFIALTLIYFNVLLSENVVSILITAFSIFTALLLNLLILVYDVVQKSKEDSMNKLKTRFIKEIYVNISFSVLTSILLIFLLLFICFIGVYRTKVLVIVLQFTVYYLTFLFLLTLLMVLKRVHVLLSNEMED